MKNITKAIHTAYQRRDAYDALQMPVYHTLAYEFDNADGMADAFCGRTDAPDYSRVLNPTVTHLEQRIANLTGEKTFKTFFEALYWSTVTLTTVGYGDLCPISVCGRTISMISSLFGIGLITAASGAVTSGFIEEIKKQEDGFIDAHGDSKSKSEKLDYDGIGNKDKRQDSRTYSKRENWQVLVKH